MPSQYITLTVDDLLTLISLAGDWERGDRAVAGFWSRVDRTGGCWLWLGTLNNQGYGHYTYKKRTRLAHRIAYELLRGPIPEGLILLHSCDNPVCVNPDHLTPGTYSDNNRDAYSKDRMGRGAKHWRSKLTEDDVRTIRARAAAGESHGMIARDYPVSRRTVSGVVSGRGWHHLTPVLSPPPPARMAGVTRPYE